MDFELSEEQRAILQSVGTLLDRRAGPERARALAKARAYDLALEEELHAAGFLDLARTEGTGALEAALVLEAIAKRAGLVAFGAAALVAPSVTRKHLAAPIALALASEHENAPVRYGAFAKTLLIADGDTVRVRTLETGDATPAPSVFGYPLAHVPRDGGDRLERGSGERMRAWWRVALAMEIAGTMRAALDFTIAYVKERRQFGRAIGSFQAIQHRLAECATLVEGSRWLALEAAHLGAPAGHASAAAAHASAAAQRIFHETHQMNGSIGFTREHHLHVWTMRLQALRLEMQGATVHRADASRARWCGTERRP
jgi:alkylation response protein AidB-like acyl-CoA dehydrogenase